MVHETDTFLTPTEVATLLRLPLATLYGWRTKGVGPPAVRVGRHLRFRREAVMAWMIERETDRSR